MTHETHAQMLRKAIESLMDAKILDVLSKPGGLDRLLAHRRTGVASYDIRMAERRLDGVLAELLTDEKSFVAGDQMG